jgi:hypothetical protein
MTCNDLFELGDSDATALMSEHRLERVFSVDLEHQRKVAGW